MIGFGQILKPVISQVTRCCGVKMYYKSDIFMDAGSN